MNKYKEHSSGRKKTTHSPLKFQDMAKKINPYLKEEHLELNFRGYKKTVMRYFQVQDHDFYEIYQLMIECNLWSNYMSEIENFIQVKMLDFQLEADRLNAILNKKIPDDFIEKEIKKVEDKAKNFSIFYKQVVAQKNFFEKAYWHCYKLYGNAVNTLKYKTHD